MATSVSCFGGNEDECNLTLDSELSAANVGRNLISEGDATELETVVKSFEVENFRIVRCPFCSNTYQGILPIQNHFLTHFKVALHPCSICKMEFPCRETLRRHLVSHASVLYKCGCHWAISTHYLDKFKEHIVRHHNGRHSGKTPAVITNRNFEASRENASHLSVGNAVEDKTPIVTVESKNLQLKPTVNKKDAQQVRGIGDDMDSNVRKLESCLLATKENKTIDKCKATTSLLKPSISRVNDAVRASMSNEERDIVKSFTHYACPFCDFLKSDRTLLLQHLYKHIVADKYVCMLCAYQCTSPKAVLLHMDTHTEKNYACDKCDFIADSDRTFSAHYADHLSSGELIKSPEKSNQSTISKILTSHSYCIGENEKSVLKYRPKNRHFCSLCPKSFRSKAECARHEGKHTGNPSHVCDICGKQFYTNSAFNKHKVSHTGRTFSCDLCSRVYSTQSSLYKHHLFVHKPTRNYVCPICSKGFAIKVHLTRHVRIHTGVKPYKCEFCDKQFSQQGNLGQHRRLHTGEKPHQCEYCSKAFALRAAYTQHVRVHTGMKVTELQRRNAVLLSVPDSSKGS